MDNDEVIGSLEEFDEMSPEERLTDIRALFRKFITKNTKPLEDRIAALEKRVAELEKQLSEKSS